MSTSKRRRHTPEQIIGKLAEGNKQLGGAMELNEVCRHLEIAESTWHRWVAQYGGMKANDAKRLKELEGENAQLRRLLANAELDKDMLRKSRRETSDPEPETSSRHNAARPIRGVSTTSL